MRTPPWTCLAVMLACATTACEQKAAPPTQAADAGKGVRVDSLAHQFGPATEGDYLEHTFVLTNDGPVPLEIREAKTNCPCLTAALSQTSIPPGGKVDLKARFDTLDRIGDQDRKVTVTFADASMAPMDLRVHAQVYPAIVLQEERTPNTPRGDLHVGDEVTRVYRVLGAHAAQAQLTIEKVDDPNLEATLADDPSGQGKVVRVVIRAPERGHFHGEVIVKTGLERKTRIVRKVDWSVAGNITTEPVAAHFELDGASGTLQPQERVAVVRSRLPGFVVQSAKSQSAAFTATLAPGKVPGTFEVRVLAADAKALPRTLSSSIQLRTNDKVEPVASIPIIITTRRPAPAASVGSATP